MKIYISGAITGTDIEKTKKQFKNIENKLIAFGHEAINPFEIHQKPINSWSDYMKEDIKELVDCDAIFMLKGWRKSKGAQLEIHIARELGLKIFTDLVIFIK